MTPIKFKEVNTIYAKDQPPYLPLPAYVDENKVITSCWKCSIADRLRILLTGKVYHSQLTFGDKLQPIRILSYKYWLKEASHD